MVLSVGGCQFQAFFFKFIYNNTFKTVAINTANTVEVDICGKKMRVADINYNVCNTCKNGACVNRFVETGKQVRALKYDDGSYRDEILMIKVL